ncbi:MAG TPA: hypothetical protein PJ989_09540 [Oligoflexia bacterium]|nr:hypothetical protein [Oligoflexia bacterium]
MDIQTSRHNSNMNIDKSLASIDKLRVIAATHLHGNPGNSEKVNQRLNSIIEYGKKKYNSTQTSDC